MCVCVYVCVVCVYVCVVCAVCFFLLEVSACAVVIFANLVRTRSTGLPRVYPHTPKVREKELASVPEAQHVYS